MKKCFKCGKEKPLSEFYAHPQMSDGHLNKCKECTKKDAAKRAADPETYKRIQEYERKRFNDPDRRKKVAAYVQKMRAKAPEKTVARNKLNNALRDGKIIKKPCEICGSKNSEGHHSNHSAALSVQWLCRKHHRIAESKN